jgi:ADP-heptose:LPS heptosyltransferase
MKYTKDITFVVNKKLKDILVYLNPKIFVTDYESLNEVDFDFQIPIGSLPKLLNISNINDINFYKLPLPRKKNNKFFKNDKFNIGLAWSGNPNYPMDKYRSISLSKFDKLLQLKKFNFYKLSKITNNTELGYQNNNPNIFDFGDKSLYEICEILKELDLVISADTSINHLAGILGVNSILLLNYNNDWRWFDNKDYNNWYPSIKIIKQTKFNSWEDVFYNLILEVNKIYEKKFR